MDISDIAAIKDRVINKRLCADIKEANRKKVQISVCIISSQLIRNFILFHLSSSSENNDLLRERIREITIKGII